MTYDNNRHCPICTQPLPDDHPIDMNLCWPCETHLLDEREYIEIDEQKDVASRYRRCSHDSNT